MTSNDAGPDPADRRQSLSVVVKAALAERGMTLTDAVTLSDANASTKIGRTKWTQIVTGTGPVPKESTLGKMAKALDFDLGVLLRAAGYDDVAERLLAREGVSSQMEAMRRELRRLADAVERLLDEPPPPPPDRPSGR